MVGSPIGCVVFLCEIEKKIKDLARKGLTSTLVLGILHVVTYGARNCRNFGCRRSSYESYM